MSDPPQEQASPTYVEDFFEHLFGFKEKDYTYAEVQQKFTLEDSGSTLVSHVNGRRFRAGTFSCPTLKELREAAKAQALQESGAAASAEGRVHETPPVHVKHVVTQDAMEDHANPSHCGALFQVASQFNCLEFTSSRSTPELGITAYAHDQTQGPACAIACAPGAVFRNYLLSLPCNPAGTAATQKGQTAELQLDTLRDVSELLGNGEELDSEGHGRYFWMENGYLISEPERLKKLRAKLSTMSEDEKDELRSALRVGITYGAQVVFSALVPFEGLVPLRSGPEKELGVESSCPEQLVSQVFCAAINVRNAPEEWEPFARLLLEATYEATLWAAVQNSKLAKAKSSCSASECASKRAILTLVGAGVFGNRLEWVADAINRALAQVAASAPPEGWGLEVLVAHFRKVNTEFESAVYLGAPCLGSKAEWKCLE